MPDNYPANVKLIFNLIQNNMATSLKCPGCGAPLASNAKKCEFCGTVINTSPVQRHSSEIKKQPSDNIVGEKILNVFQTYSQAQLIDQCKLCIKHDCEECSPDDNVYDDSHAFRALVTTVVIYCKSGMLAELIDNSFGLTLRVRLRDNYMISHFKIWELKKLFVKTQAPLEVQDDYTYKQKPTYEYVSRLYDYDQMADIATSFICNVANYPEKSIRIDIITDPQDCCIVRNGELTTELPDLPFSDGNLKAFLEPANETPTASCGSIARGCLVFIIIIALMITCLNSL